MTKQSTDLFRWYSNRYTLFADKIFRFLLVPGSAGRHRSPLDRCGKKTIANVAMASAGIL